ncbi:MAG: cell division protein SepF [Actinomycetota bacterium]
MGAVRNSLVYLGFIEDDLEDEIGAYQEPYQEGLSNIRKITHDQVSMVRPVAPVRVRPIDQVHIVEPESYQDASEIGDKLRDSVPVIMNLKGAEEDLFQRVMAFACGLVYGLDGALQKLMPRVYLLTPSQIEVSTEDKTRLAALSL